MTLYSSDIDRVMAEARKDVQFNAMLTVLEQIVIDNDKSTILNKLINNVVKRKMILDDSCREIVMKYFV